MLLNNVEVSPIWAILILWLAVIVGLSLYRLLWHPLAQYPGPFWAKITDFYPATQAFRGVLHTDIYECHLKYGDVVRYGPNRLAFWTSKGLKDVYGFSKKVKKSKAYIPLHPRSGEASTLSSINKTQHASKRRVMSHGLSDANVRAFEPTMKRLIEKFCQILLPDDDKLVSDGWGKSQNISTLCNWLTMDIGGEFGFGKSFEMLEKPDNRYIIDIMTGASFRNGTLVQYPFLKQFHLDKLLFPKGLRRAYEFLSFTRRLLEERVARGNGGNDLFGYIIGAKDPVSGDSFSMESLWAESAFLLVAGSDTTSVGLSACFFYLCRYPEAYAMLARGIRTTFSSTDEIIGGPKMATCTYLDACIEESMRLSPPVSACLWRETEDEGATVDGEVVPAGIDVGCGIYAIHHNEKIYEQPFVFNPERWIVSDDNPREKVEAARRGLATFMLGPRSCIGRSFAMAEMRMVIARTMFQYDFRQPEGDAGRVGENKRHTRELSMVSHLTNYLQGPMVQFRACDQERLGQQV